ncbi:E3 ubiquitin-protein ligase CCNB1IP1-like [Branchiostoma floridae]|uniref:E3 ubiquitin-protein ligase CCNB1IP1-like n=1 Tax=Branchiostoma floridae TaxID=7739 RepID=A0A9J7LP81_BRAFL|nr:E3 ubiquitin-protein ligase CCNB1IP1-like [Branchiostoma floridae]
MYAQEHYWERVQTSDQSQTRCAQAAILENRKFDDSQKTRKGRESKSKDVSVTMDNDLICNFKKCRKRLTAFAWVTSCSHIFCDDDGTREFNKCYTCPACETSLSDKFDTSSNISQISHQERTYQEYMCNKAKERSVQLEKYYEQVLTTTQAELSCILLSL